MPSRSPSPYLIAARIAGALRFRWRQPVPFRARRLLSMPPGTSVVIPSRNGRELLAAQLEGIVGQARALPIWEIIVVDNGSSDGTTEWLATEWPEVQVVVSAEPLSFARAVNNGIRVAQYSHVCLLNNDMSIDPSFFSALLAAFDRVPDLFCATAQIRFPPGVRREETGKAVMAQSHPEDFPLRCDDPLPGEDLTWVLYGSGGCSLYDVAKLRFLGSMDDMYHPAYAEDLDLGYRAWLQGWPSVYVAGAVVEHRHRATTSRYYTEAQLQEILETNYLRFLARAVVDQRLFRRLWNQAIERLAAIAVREPAAGAALRRAWQFAFEGGEFVECKFAEDWILAVTDGSVAIFPGQGSGPLIISTDAPPAPPAPELLEGYAEVILVRGAPDGLAFRAALELTQRKWPGRPVPTSGPA